MTKKCEKPEIEFESVPVAPKMTDTQIVHEAQLILIAEEYHKGAEAAQQLARVLRDRAQAARASDHNWSLKLSHQQIRANDELQRAMATAQRALGDELLKDSLHLALAT